jgi:hypothetical protein
MTPKKSDTNPLTRNGLVGISLENSVSVNDMVFVAVLIARIYVRRVNLV